MQGLAPLGHSLPEIIRKSAQTIVHLIHPEAFSHGFGVLAIQDLGKILRSKGIQFKEQCHIFGVCNPKQAERVLNIQMKLNMALPCRISVYTEDKQTHISMIRPEGMLLALSDDVELKSIANEVECTMIEMIQTASKINSNS